MAKGKKVDDKAREGAQITIDVDNFIRTRDSVSPSLFPSFLLVILHLTRRIHESSTLLSLDMDRHNPRPISPPHSHHHWPDNIRHSISSIRTSTRSYPERVRHCDFKVEASCKDAPPLFTFYASAHYALIAQATKASYAIQTLSSAYIKHTNAVLGDHASAAEIDSSLAKLGDNPALLGDLQRAPSPARSGAGDGPTEKKERKKRQHDPNAPKRPLTPFFLYMQTARSIIADDLGPEAAKGAVSAEGTRRWSTMPQDDKQLWTNAYKDNLRLYNARMHYYRKGNQDAKDMTDQDALVYAEEHNIGADTSADAQLVGEASATALNDEDAEGEPDKEPTPPPKTPKVKPTRKARGSKETPVVEAPPTSSSIVPPKAAAPEKEKSPDKKRKRASKKGAAEELAEELQVETPKSAPKPRKKKAKADS
ncbi:hypothetical protein G7Y89_g11220 [Cudoniella acicularis]|uniref:HMG box domain-containing protein n=1 Tax=Cudoniella acicularis TaxID=354080 RepID=A0A8H4W0U8_9HELO|nr:hypothetical protein G7Y89_g11220 [Cudoniella acicularis]